MRLRGTGESAGRHQGSLQAGTNTLSAHALGIASLALCLGGMKGLVGNWRKTRKRELGRWLETRKGDLVRKLEKARIYGQTTVSHSDRPSLVCATPACPFTWSKAERTVTLPEKLPITGPLAGTPRHRVPPWLSLPPDSEFS